MITIISGSNRKDNKTVHFAKYVYLKLQERTNDEVRFFDLSGIEGNVISDDMYKNQTASVTEFQDTYFIPSSKFWFFIPEYNGSYPGILKLVLDAISVRELQQSFFNKKACITGIASGRAGNLRGMDHLSDVLNHLGMYVHPNKNPISSIYKLLDNDNKVMDENLEKSLDLQMKQFLEF
ncbi:MAG: NADPH-dependent FMN reductase [Maribacter sp.]